MYGGKVINSGSETCVFSPPVQCKNIETKYPPDKYVTRYVVDMKETLLQLRIWKAVKALNYSETLLQNFLFAIENLSFLTTSGSPSTT